MKYIIISLLLFFTANAQNVWYVSREAPKTGANDGRTWETAWCYFDSSNNNSYGVNWYILNPGDTVYVDGGADSTRYYPRLQEYPYYGTEISPSNGYKSFASGNPVIVCPSWESGRNGEVWFTDEGYDAIHGTTNVRNLSNVKFVNLHFYSQSPSQAITVGITDADSLLTFDNCVFRTDGQTGVVALSMASKLTIENSTLEIDSNAYPNDQDLLTGSGGNGGIIIRNNKMYYRNTYESILGNQTGSADVTVTATSLTDTRLAPMDSNYHINNSVWIGLWYLQITGNGENTFYGAEWIFEPVTQNSITGQIITPTTLTDNEGLSGYPDDAFAGCYIIMAGDTLLVTSSTDRVWVGTGGWYPSTPSAAPYTIVGGDNEPTDGVTWYMGGAHRDYMQISGVGNTDTFTDNLVYNNLIVNFYEQGTNWNGIGYFVGVENGSWTFFNNIVVNQKNSPMSTFWVRPVSDNSADFYTTQVIRMFNNTVITSKMLFHANADSAFCLNNLVVIDSAFATYHLISEISEYTYLLNDYNIYARPNGFGSTHIFIKGSPWYDWGGWQGANYDLNGDTTQTENVIFVDKYGGNKEDYYTETGRDLGINLETEYPDLIVRFPDLLYDAVGNLRSGTWDIGALEYRPPLRKWVGLGHSVMERLWDYGGKLGDDSSTVPTMLEEIYRQFNSQHSWGADSIAAESRYFPAVHGTSWWAWQSSFRGTIDDGSGAWLVGLIDTFDVIIIKGSINSTVMTGYGSPDDTSGAGVTYQTMYNYKWQWRSILDVMKQHPEKFFVMMTGVPSPDWYNTPTGAQLSYEFCTWAKDTLANGLDSYGAFPENVYVFDLFHYLSDSEHYLRDEYELSGVDEHPNSEAIRYVEPIWINEVGNAVLAFDGVVETPADTIPSFSFTALNNMELNTAYTSNSTFSGADSTFTVYTTTGARFNINSSGSLSTTPKTAVNGDVVYVETVTGSSYSTGYAETIIAGGQSRSFTVTTKAEPIVPSGNGGFVKGSDGKIWRTSDGKIIKVTQ